MTKRLQGKHSSLFFKYDWLVASILGFIAVSMLVAIFMWQGHTLAIASLGGRWFQSDAWRVFDDMVNLEANRYRNDVRPLFTLIALPITMSIKNVFKLNSIQAIWGFHILCILIWAVMLFLTIRLLGLSKFRAFVIVLLGIFSGAAIFWFTVPETYGLSCLSIILCLFLAAYETHHKTSDLSLILASTFCLGTLVTNWIAGLALLFVFRNPKKAISLACVSFFIVLLGWGVQKTIFPQPAPLFIKVDFAREKQYMFNKEQGNSLYAINTMFISSMVVPQINQYEQRIQASGKRLTIQKSVLINSGWLHSFLAFSWLFVLALGIIQLLQNKKMRKFSLVILSTLASQIALHSIYGEETFLYSLHFITILVVLSASSLRSLNRSKSIILIIILIFLIAVNNLIKFNYALKTTNINTNDERLYRLNN